MAQPAIVTSELSSPLADFAPLQGGEGPANRALAELGLLLDVEAPDEFKWDSGKSLRFVFATCGLFWLAAAFAAYAFP